MSTEAKREVGELLAGQVENLPESVQDALVCGCFAEDIDVMDGVTWAYTRGLGFHDPTVPHKVSDDQLRAVRLLFTGTEGGYV